MPNFIERANRHQQRLGLVHPLVFALWRFVPGANIIERLAIGLLGMLLDILLVEPWKAPGVNVIGREHLLQFEIGYQPAAESSTHAPCKYPAASAASSANPHAIR